MNKLLIMLLMASNLTAVRTSRDIEIFIHENNESSPTGQISKHKRSNSCPSPDKMRSIQEILNIGKPHYNTPVLLERREEHIIELDKFPTDMNPKESKRRCAPSVAVVAISLCTGCVGITTAIITAVVTLTIHFTTK